MKRDPKQNAWIPLTEYTFHGARKPRTRIDPFACGRRFPLPETWVPIEEAILHGAEKHTVVTDGQLIQPLKPPAPPPEVPPEAYLTLFDALREVWAVPRADGPVFSRLQAMATADRKEWSSGRISAAEYLRRQQAVEAIRADYAARAEAVTDWFLENRLRLFETLPNA